MSYEEKVQFCDALKSLDNKKLTVIVNKLKEYQPDAFKQSEENSKNSEILVDKINK